jgi:hypothetical protein
MLLSGQQRRVETTMAGIPGVDGAMRRGGEGATP